MEQISKLNGKCLRGIINMYNVIKARLPLKTYISETFPRQIGVPQGGKPVPFLFSILLNDLKFSTSTWCKRPTYSKSNVWRAAQDIPKFDLFPSLYADDTILLAESADSCQKS